MHLLAADPPPVAEYSAYALLVALAGAILLKAAPAVARWCKEFVEGVIGRMQATLDTVIADSKANRETFERTSKETRDTFERVAKEQRHAFAEQIQARDAEIDRERERYTRILEGRLNPPTKS